MHHMIRHTAFAGARTLLLTVASCAITSVVLAAEPVAVATSPMAHQEPHLVLLGSHEVPPVETKASAISNIVIGADLTVKGSVDTSGIDRTAAHIHLGAAGTNGPPIITLVKTSASQWSVPAGSSVTQAQYDSYMHGDLYVNVHSLAHPGGEIRVQLSE